MARIVGVDIPRNKKIAFSLCYIHGIGMSTALEICKTAKIDTDKRVQDLTDEQVVALRNAISKIGLLVEGELRSDVAMNIKRLKVVGAYKGLRHRRGLPARLCRRRLAWARRPWPTCSARICWPRAKRRAPTSRPRPSG